MTDGNGPQRVDDAALPAELSVDPEQLPSALRPVEDATGVAVITGASSGIGRATALALGARGWALSLVARRAERLSEVAAEVRRLGGHALTAAIDASDASAVLAVRDRTIARFGVPHAIVNSAGGGRWQWMEDTSTEAFDAMLDAPFRAAWHTTHAFLPDLLAAGRGVVVHVGSPGSLAPWPGATAYTTSRFALRGLHEALCQDLAGTGVHSCHVILGEVTSEYFIANPDSQQHIPRIARIIPVISPERAARVVVRTIERPRAQVLHPRVLRVLAAANRLVPGIVALLARRTGRKR
jgi:NADP-dependent 3-hydroxy acid dehydrogenase YdfG